MPSADRRTTIGCRESSWLTGSIIQAVAARHDLQAAGRQEDAGHGAPRGAPGPADPGRHRDGGGFCRTFFYADTLVKWLRVPLQNMFMPGHLTWVPTDLPTVPFVFLAPAEALWQNVKVAGLFALVLPPPISCLRSGSSSCRDCTRRSDGSSGRSSF